MEYAIDRLEMLGLRKLATMVIELQIKNDDLNDIINDFEKYLKEELNNESIYECQVVLENAINKLNEIKNWFIDDEELKEEGK